MDSRGKLEPAVHTAQDQVVSKGGIYVALARRIPKVCVAFDPVVIQGNGNRSSSESFWFM